MAELTIVDPDDPRNRRELRDRLALALDVDDLDTALALARRLRRWFGVVKVGLELHAAAGPAAVDALHEIGLAVFLDLKLHDIPTQVARACRVHARSGVEYLNVHASGGRAMLDAAVEAVAGTPTTLLAVTVLTSDPDVRAFDARLALAIDAGCGGVVCSAHELGRARDAAPREFVTMVPGVRLPGTAVHEQARVATPGAAIGAGASVLVVGRTVTSAADPRAAAQAVHDDVWSHARGRPF